MFDENKLRTEIARTWGECGAHMEIFDALIEERDRLREAHGQVVTSDYRYKED